MPVEPGQVEDVVVGARRLVELLDAVVVRVAVLEYLNTCYFMLIAGSDPGSRVPTKGRRIFLRDDGKR